MEDHEKSDVYNISLCRICQDPQNMDLIDTSSRLQNYNGNETLMGALKSIFSDIRWIEDEFISMACKMCFEKVSQISEFKSMCAKTNFDRSAMFLAKSDVDSLEIPTVKKIESKQLLDNESTKQKSAKRKRKPSKKSLDAKNKYWGCEICGEAFKNSRLLERHVFRHDGTRNYICPVCGRKYITNGDLITHYKSHSVDLKFECDICQKRFKAIRNLSTHKAIVHMDPKDYKHLCTICGNKYPTSERLKEHTKRHNQIKNYSCDLCAKAFVSKAEMLRHASSHSNYQPFKCDLCSVEYKKKDFLLVHKSRQHGIGNYKRRLKQCEKPYQCRLCDAKFICKSNIKPHLKKKHDINVDLRYDQDATEYYNVVLEDNNKETA